MTEGASRPRVWSIAAHRGFADALVAGLIPRYREDRFGLARLTLLLPSQRAIRTVTDPELKQDWISAERKKARDQQFRMRC